MSHHIISKDGETEPISDSEKDVKKNIKAGSRHSTKDQEHGTQAIDHMLQAGFTHPKFNLDDESGGNGKSIKKASVYSCLAECEWCISCCLECIRQCQACPSGDARHAECVRACKECIVHCHMCLHLCRGAGTSAECVEACRICAQACDACYAACSACASCPICAECCKTCAECCEKCAEACHENAGDKPGEAQGAAEESTGKSLTGDIWVGAGAEIKALGDGHIGGYAVTFSDKDNPDLSDARDYFNAKTYLGARQGDGCDVTINHGIPLSDIHPVFEKYADMILPPVKTKLDETGLFAETVVNMSDEYQRMVYDLAEKKKLRWSTGAVGHLVKRERKSNGSHELKRWIIGEFALTPMAAEPANIVMPLKSYKSLVTKQGDLQSDPKASEGAEAQSEDKDTEAKSLSLELELLELEATF